MTYGEMLSVIQSAIAGKAIEHRDAFNDWRPCVPSVPKEFLFYGSNEYRTAPEPRKPREWWAEIPLDDFSVGQIFTDVRQLTKGGELVKVREVIE